MWYAITGGVGLFTGLGLLIWGLTERSKRSAAEMAAEKAGQDAKRNAVIAANNAQACEDYAKKLTQVQAQLDTVRSRADEALQLLMQYGDKQSVKTWLDKELGETKV